jgi:hypothetical protein
VYACDVAKEAYGVAKKGCCFAISRGLVLISRGVVKLSRAVVLLKRAVWCS